VAYGLEMHGRCGFESIIYIVRHHYAKGATPLRYMTGWRFMIKFIAFLKVITLYCDQSGGRMEPKIESISIQGANLYSLARLVVVICQKNDTCTHNPSLAERCLRLPPCPLSIANLRPFPSPCFGVGSVLFSVSSDFRKSSRCIQTMSFWREDRRTPQELHLQLSPQELPEQHLQSPQGPMFRILGVE
jgi:hypothetical protein